ncbi:MAG: hypothetical protein HQL20_06420 [Candidatus Omnitrophica bacterium]|nr:hypothetical protein [Candidatus Omnitrophota bacterium]
MNYQTLVSIGVCIALAIAIGSAFIKLTSSQFTKSPAEQSFQGASVREQASQRAESTAERQRRMMENLKDRMERNKR